MQLTNRRGRKLQATELGSCSATPFINRSEFNAIKFNVPPNTEEFSAVAV